LFNPHKCPKCGGTIEHIDEHQPIGGFIARYVGAEMLMYIIAGMLLLIGLQWPPALIVGGVIAFWLFFIREKNKFNCNSCGAQFKYGELYKTRDS
jgi:predicted nucleic-acid-binding Zn-ribbon protein